MKPTNREVVIALNARNNVSEARRTELIDRFGKGGNASVARLLRSYLSAMDQDGVKTDLPDPLPRPVILRGAVAARADETVGIVGIGGMFAYLNVLFQAHKHGGSHCIVTHPRDIWSFSGWTLHPEEDMDQRLVSMFQTKNLFLGEANRFFGRCEPPESLRFKAFRIDYPALWKLSVKRPGELLKFLQVNLKYVAGELCQRERRFARINLERNRATVEAFRKMGVVGNDPDRDFLRLDGRVAFEVAQEPRVAAKAALKREYGLEGRVLSVKEVRSLLGARLPMEKEVAEGRIRAVQCHGGCFLPGFKENALKAARRLGVRVYDDALATRILVDPVSGRFGVDIRTPDGSVRTIAGLHLLMALGGYGKGIIPVDGVSALLAVGTENQDYRIPPTVLGEGGTIHIVPVAVFREKEGNAVFHYHLVKATNGAIVGRDPREPKRLAADKAFLLHLEAMLRKIIPGDSYLVWLAATECGRPVTARQGYRVGPLKPETGTDLDPRTVSVLANSFEAAGGCGLGGNTPIIPEVQDFLDRHYG